jgi:toxin YoeB
MSLRWSSERTAPFGRSSPPDPVKVGFTSIGWQDYQHWVQADLKILGKINALIGDIRRSPFKGLGKPEPLREDRAGWWSRRITQEHRLVYRVTGAGDDQRLEIAQCRFHY